MLVAAVVGLAAGGGWWLYQSPLLAIQSVTVEGTVTLSDAEVLGLADLKGQSLIRPDFAGASDALLALPTVKSVSISRDWPRGAHVSIAERTPWGVWEIAGNRLVVDEEGVVLDAPAPEGAPVIVRADAAAPAASSLQVDEGAIAVASRLVPTSERTLGRPVVGLDFSQASGLTVVLGGVDGAPDLRAVFGDAQNYDFKVAALYSVLRQAESEGRAVTRVDLRFGGRVAVRWEQPEEDVPEEAIAEVDE